MRPRSMFEYYGNDELTSYQILKFSQVLEQSKLLPILRTTIGLFLIDYNHSYDDVNTC